MILIRFLLIGLIVYLIIRSFTKYGKEEAFTGNRMESEKDKKTPVKKVSKEIGEYVDYEDVDK